MATTQLLHIPVTNITERQDALRGLDPENVEYQRVRDSIQREGVLNAISVVPAYMPDGSTPKTNPETGEPVYVLVDGLQRLSACRDLGLETIPAQVLQKGESEVLAVQLMANANRVKTKPSEFTQHLCRILAADPTLTKIELADRLCVSVQFSERRLSLGNIDPEVGKLVDSGDIVLTNAYELAKLPVEEQKEFAQAAMSDQPAVFKPNVQKRIKDIRDAKRAGRDPNAKPEFEAVPHLRKLSELKDLYDDGQMGQVEEFIRQAGLENDGVAAAKTILRWVLRMDDKSVAHYKAEWEARQKKREEEKILRQKERAEKRAQEAAQAAAALQAAE